MPERRYRHGNASSELSLFDRVCLRPNTGTSILLSVHAESWELTFIRELISSSQQELRPPDGPRHRLSRSFALTKLEVRRCRDTIAASSRNECTRFFLD